MPVGLCRPATVLLVVADWRGSQGGHGKQWQLHLGYSMAV